MLESIHREHGQMVRLLALLREKIAIIESGEQEVEYPLIRAVIEYLQERAEKYHHPKEDILYLHLKRHYPAYADTVDNLESEHAALAQVTQAFADTLEMILMDAVVPLDLFKSSLMTFVERQQAHLEQEERQVLPLIKNTFNASDWAAVSEQWQHDVPDPLFGDRVAKRYQILADRLAM